MPPIVKRETPAQKNHKSPAPSAEGSLLSQAVDVGQLCNQYIKMVIYGQNRVGKTTLACDFPKPLLLVAYEPNKTGGALSVTKVPGVKILRLDSTQASLRLAGELMNDTYFQTIVLDGATSLQDILLKEILGLPAVPEMLHFKQVSKEQYQKRSEDLRENLRPFLNLNKHTVVLAKEKDHNPPKGEEIWEGYGRRKIAGDMRQESFFASDVGTAVAGWLHDNCDYIARLYVAKETRMEEQVTVVGKERQVSQIEVETGRLVHRLRTLYHPNYAAGFRSSTPDAIPEYIQLPEGVYNGRAFERIQKVINGEKS